MVVSGKAPGKNKINIRKQEKRMKQLLQLLSEHVADAFCKAGYEADLGKTGISNRQDLCEYQCNGAMAGAKRYHKAPIVIAGEVAAILKDDEAFEMAEAVKPGFINLNVSRVFLQKQISAMAADPDMSVEKTGHPKKIIIDYGGANVAKPLHVGHLRSAVIGESIKRILRFMGNEVLGDVHLGDWGLQMGLIITELHERKPDLPYFDLGYEGEYPDEAPFTISELEEIYPAASRRSKEDADYKARALEATKELQMGRRGYRALWKHIMNVSVRDLKKNYDNLDVHFDLWKGESDTQSYIPGMVQYLKDNGYAHYDQGALVVDVKEETDTKEIPPCMILKSDGSSLYDTTDLATLVMRREQYDPDEVIYVVDKRQELHFVQDFRCAKKTHLVKEDTGLIFLGFGTMNGKDGKPFKTREGGVMRLENLIRDINEEMYRKIMDNHAAEPEEARETAKIVALSAIKYGDLSNQASKDYIFDVDKFTSFEGNTGPYILYTIVRIKSILNRYTAAGGKVTGCRIGSIVTESEKELMMELAGYGSAVRTTAEELAPHKLCAYIYGLANAFNHFYHETKILSEEDENRKANLIALIDLTRKVLEQSVSLLGFCAPERM